MAHLEHVNLTVPDADALAEILCDLFDWQIRWSGDVLGGAGRSVHVGDADDYLALYTPKAPIAKGPDSYETALGLNHIGIVVDDLEATQARVTKAGFRSHNHADYEPGRRFYFDGPQGIEIEVVSYT